MQRPCDQCGKSYDAKRPNSRFCGDGCRQRHKRTPELAVTSLPVSAEPTATGTVHAATLTELEAAGRSTTALGTAALALAARIDLGADTGSALASAVKALGETLTAATKGAQVARTQLDEVRARRDAKRGA